MESFLYDILDHLTGSAKCQLSFDLAMKSETSPHSVLIPLSEHEVFLHTSPFYPSELQQIGKWLPFPY
ncbi:hypothetical protein T06_16625 [Trichinella sp. T6]|nr:hypothetical protein T06_16625 [Trichinella sp. T6]